MVKEILQSWVSVVALWLYSRMERLHWMLISLRAVSPTVLHVFKLI